MEASYVIHSETNAGTEDEFSSSLKKIIDKQNDLDKIKIELEKENDILTNNLCLIKQHKEGKIKQRETLKLSLVREQDNFDYNNARLINEILTVKALFANVDSVTELSNDFIAKNLNVASFFDGISRSYMDLQESTNNLALKITQENMCIRDKVTTLKQYKEKLLSDIQNDIVQCEKDLEDINNAVLCLKKCIFEKNIEFSKLSVTLEYVCDEESKDALNLQNLETKLEQLTIDGRNFVDENQLIISDLEKRNATLRKTLSEMEIAEQEAKQLICDEQQNLNDLGKNKKEKELEEECCNEELQLKNNSVNELVKIQCSLEKDLKVKEDFNQDNEKMIAALQDMEKKYNELISEKDDIESDIAVVDNDMKVYLQDIESEKHNQSEEIAIKEKLQADIDALTVHSTEMNENHRRHLNSLNVEIENAKGNLREFEDSLLEIQTTNTDKTREVQEYTAKLQENRNALALVMDVLEFETNKVNEYKKNIKENQEKYIKLSEEMNTTLNLRNEELIAREKSLERKYSLKEEIIQAKAEIEKQEEQIQFELQQLENDNSFSKNDVEERLKTLKMQLENKHKQIKTELLEYQTGLTELENVEHKLNISTAAIKEELANVKNKTIQIFNTKKLMQSKFSKASQNLRSAEQKSDDVSGSQISVLKHHDDDDDDSSSGISTSDPKWAVPKRKSGDTFDEERSQKKYRGIKNY